MSEKKSIDDKVLLRAIADMVIQNPSYAREMFNDADDIINIFPELEVISDFLLQSDYNDYFQSDYNNYKQYLEDTIRKIPDTETNKIFLMALNSQEI